LQLAQVYDAANTILAQKIAQVQGVGQVFVGGGQNPAVRVQVDPAVLAGLGLGMEDVRTVLSQATVDQPKGTLAGASQAQSIAANDQLVGAKSFRDLVISYQGGAAVRLGDVARVIDDVEDNRVAAWTNGTRSVSLLIRRQPGANIIEVIDRIKRMLPGLAQSVSPSIDIQVAVDRAGTIRASVRDVERTLLLSVFLVVLVVFAFLRNLRATLIPSVVVPLSLVGTFAAMYLLGYSLNNLSLMALTIATGFVVDDAIVVTENVSRFVEAGEKPLMAALKGARQIGFTIVSITVSLLAVFIPILVMGGIVGRLFREFAVTLAVSIAISAIISLTLTPMMTSRLLRLETEQRRGLVFRVSEGFFNGMLGGYRRGLDWVLRHHYLMLFLTIGAAVVTVFLYKAVPKGLFPQQDTGQLAGVAEAPQDVSFPAMRQRAEAVNKVVLAHPAVEKMVTFIGGSGSSGNTGNIFIQLKPLGQRSQTSDQVIAELRPKLAAIPGIMLFLQSVQDVRMGGRGARTQYQYTLQDANLAELNQWAPRVFDTLKALPELRDVASDQQTNALQLSLEVDRDIASSLGVSLQAVDGTLYDAFGQRQVATMYTQLNQYRVVLEAKPGLAGQPVALDNMYVHSQNGALVPLSVFAHWAPSRTSLSISHQGQFPAITLSFNLAPEKSLSQALDAIHSAESRIGLPAGVVASPQGTAKAFVDSLVQSADPDSGRAAGRVHRSRCALRKSNSPGDDSVHVALGRRGRLAGTHVDAHGIQHHCAHWRDPAHRHREEERHHDDRLRAAGRARARIADPRRHLPGLPVALPPHHDDHHGGTTGRLAAGFGSRHRF
jgi:multidrug efflux pump subunit AcrB